jgi:hypothetical protein
MSNPVALPSQINYKTPLLKLPSDTTNFLATSTASNGSSFGESSIIQVDLNVNRGFLDPASLAFRYNVECINDDGVEIVGTPAYSFIGGKMQCYVNSQTIESVSNYGVLCNLLTNLKFNTAQKLGVQYAYGYRNSTSANVANESMDGRTLVEDDNFALSAPLHCMLANSQKLIPLFLLQNMRFEITTASIAELRANFTTNLALDFSSYKITNFEITYNVVDFGYAVQQSIIAENPTIQIKSGSYNTASAPIADGVSGSLNLVYSLRYASVNSVFVTFGGSDVDVSINKNYDSYDVTSGSGDYQINIAGMTYPNKSLSAKNNKAGILQELRRAQGNLFLGNNSLSINSAEFGGVSATVTTIVVPSKFIFGCNTSRMTVNSDTFFSGISTQNAPMTLIINTSTVTAQAHTAILHLFYDCILEINTSTKQLIVIS